MASSDSLSGLMKWMNRPEWSDEFQTVFWDHIGAPCEELGVDVADLGALLGDHPASILLGCAFEDFVTRAIGEDQRNIVDDYVKRRGWKEAVANKRYMLALRDSEMSLYEVSEVVPGQSFLARDLVREGKPVRVSEQTATRTLKQWDHLATRIVELNGRHIMSGGTLLYNHALSEDALRELRAAKRSVRRKLKTMMGERDAAPDAATQRATADALAMALAAPFFTSMWLEDALDGVMGHKRPRVVNSDGDDIEFCRVRLPLRPGGSAEQVRARLDAVAELQSDDGNQWTWSGPASGPKAAALPSEPTAANGSPLAATFGADGVSLGTVELLEAAVVLGTNSRARAERGQALLTAALDGLVGVPLTEIQTMEQMLAARPADAAPPENTIPRDVQAKVVHELADRHYRAQLDQPIPALGNVTPRAAAATAPGRRKLVAWLKDLENNTAQKKAAGDPLGDYDFGFMWSELGIAELRK